MNASLVYKNLFNLFIKSFNSLFIILLLLMVIESFVAILTILSIAPFADYLIDSSLSNPSKITLNIIYLLETFNLKPSLYMFGAIFVITNIFRAALEIFIRWVVLKIKYLVIKKINIKLLTSLMQSKWSYISKVTQGELLNSLIRETGGLGDCMGMIAYQFASLIKLLTLLIVPVFLYPKFMITTILLGVICFLPFLYFYKIIYKLGIVTTKTSNGLVENLSEIIGNIKLIKGFVRNDFMIKKYKKIFNTHSKSAVDSGTLSYGFSAVYQPLGILAIVSSTIFFQTLLIADFAVIMWTLVQSLPLAGRLLATHSNIINSYASYEQISKIQNIADQNQENLTNNSIDKIDNIKLENISFAYDNKNILKNISFAIKKGQLIAISGISGSGKSTLIDLIMGFQSPDKGLIKVNDINLNTLNMDCYRKLIGYVPQDNHIFTGSLRSNLTFAKLDATDKDIYRAINFADANKIIKDLSQDLDSKVSDGGSNFSGGQKQKIALSRAILKDPDLYLLDETTSSLDKISESTIFQNFKKLKNNSAMLLITHNISSLINVDYIYFIEHGVITGHGSYLDLKRENKSFKKLCDQQDI